MSTSSAGASRGAFSELPFGPKTLLLGAGAVVLYGLTRRSKSGMAIATAGGVLALGAVKAQPPAPTITRSTFLINTDPHAAYTLWRDFENLPRFMAHFKSVRVLDGSRSAWIARGPMDREISWTAEITEDIPDSRIAWRSLPGSDVQTSGCVVFSADPQRRGTFVTAEVEYALPGGALARLLASVAGKHPEFIVREDLRRFKALLEARESPTTAGQTHGPRGVHGHTEQILFRETSNHAQPQSA
jgi:uncharacterized membrane protein